MTAAALEVAALVEEGAAALEVAASVEEVVEAVEEAGHQEDGKPKNNRCY